MKRRWLPVVPIMGAIVLGACLAVLAGAQAPATGPDTEKRFPPLCVPEGFKATLFACDPLVEYPSAIALGPRPGTIFVAVDYMTGLGTEIVRRDEIRLIEDTDGDGYADRSTVYADGFNSIEGLTFHGGTVYAMHAPLLTALRDVDGDGRADERRDLANGLGLPPEKNPHRLHCANGLVMGHDGWLYLALGDHGCDALRPEGDRLVLEGGGILRCRSDGSDLHVFATGLRNIYDVALDDGLNVFVRDNENDGGEYKIRVCHSFFGADHGYPYLYNERPEEALPPLADLGLGSSAGGLCYLERQFPDEYHGNLFFCEWGRSAVRYPLQRLSTGGFARVHELQFAAGAENDPYGFKPTDMVVERDGSLIVADWADGQQPKRGRGRIYRIRHGDAADDAGQPPGADDPEERSLDSWLKQLDSMSYYERVEAQERISDRGDAGLNNLLLALKERNRVGVRARLHAVWILARFGSPRAVEELFELVNSDPEPRVQAQAVRALGDLSDPTLTRRHRDSVPGVSEISRRLAATTDGKDATVVLEAIVALGRLRWKPFPVWLLTAMTQPRLGELTADPAFSHAVMQTLRRSGNWPAVLALVDLPRTHPLRPIAWRANAGQAHPEVFDGLIARLPVPDAEQRRQCAEALTRIHRIPGPWTYWGYRPAPRPANPVAWERTAAIEEALDSVLSDRDRGIRLACLRRMQRERIPARLATLKRWISDDRTPECGEAILESLSEHPIELTSELLATLVADSKRADANRRSALTLLKRGLDDDTAIRLLSLAQEVDEGSVLALLLRELSRRHLVDAAPVLIRRLSAHDATVRAAAADGLAEMQRAESAESIARLLDDSESPVRRAAAAAMGRLNARTSVPTLLRLAEDRDADVRSASLESLRLLGEARAVPGAVAALADRRTQSAALRYLEALGGPDQSSAVIEAARRDPTVHVLQPAARMLTKWSLNNTVSASIATRLHETLAELQGRSGLLVRWQAQGPFSESEASRVLDGIAARSEVADFGPDKYASRRFLFSDGLDAHVDLGNAMDSPPDDASTAPREGAALYLASTDMFVAEPSQVQFLGAATGRFQVWVNGRRMHDRAASRPFQPDSERFEGELAAGFNRVVVQIAATGGAAGFHLRFRRKSSTAEYEAFVQAALAGHGDAERGRKVFFDEANAQCSRCHRIGDKGDRIGPELTGIGARFSRIHLIESILEPSLTVAPGFQTVTVSLSNGKVLTGVRVAETETTLTLGDHQGKTHPVAKSDIEERADSPQSIMPDGLARLMGTSQFVDLIAFLVGQAEKQP